MDVKLDREKLEQTTWGADFLKEMEYVIAANSIKSLIDGTRLNHINLNHLVADFCAKFDKALVEEYHGIIDIHDVSENSNRTLDDAVAFLKEKPRGSWAIFKQHGVYNAVMSNGYGRITTAPTLEDGYDSPSAPDLNFTALYASCLSLMVYNERQEVHEQIFNHSASQNNLKPGDSAKDNRLRGTAYESIKFVGAHPGYFHSGNTAYEVVARKQGVDPETCMINGGALVRLFDLPLSLPNHLNPQDGIDRTVRPNGLPFLIEPDEGITQGLQP